MQLVTAVFHCTGTARPNSHAKVVIRHVGHSKQAGATSQQDLSEEDMALLVEMVLSLALLNIFEHVSVESIEVVRWSDLD